MMPENEIINDPIVLDTQNTEIIEVDVLEVTPSTGSADVLNHANLNNRDSTDAHPMSAITGLTEALDDIEAIHSVHAQAAQESIEEAFETLDEHTTQISTIEANINFLAQKVGANETNVVSAIYVANQAYNKAQEVLESTSISEEAIRDALENILESEERIDAFESIIESSAETSAQAKAIAEGAVSSANAIKEEAVQRANEAFAIAEDVQSEAHSLCAKIDQYSVGEYSQAYGLTKDQANRILVPGMIYVPTAHPVTQYHQEEYDGSEETKYVRWFTPGYLYRWGLIDTNKYGWLTIGNDPSPSAPEDYSDPDTAVAPVVGPCVYFATIEPEIDPSNVYNYWYTNGNTVSPETYAPYTLYERQGDAWVAVATLMGNASNRMTSEIYQSTNRITLDVANAQGSIAAFDARLEETESTITSLAEWQHGGEVSKAIIRQHSEDGNASIVISTIQQDGENVAEASMVLTASQNDGSALVMSADNIDFEAGDFTINADHINLNGAVTANNNVTISEDGKITAVEANISGTITATGGVIGGCQIENGVLTVDAANITGTLTADKIDTTELTVDAANITGTLTADKIDTSELTVDAVNITGTLTADQIDTGDILGENAVFSGDISSASGTFKGQIEIDCGTDNLETAIISSNGIVVTTKEAQADGYARSATMNSMGFGFHFIQDGGGGSSETVIQKLTRSGKLSIGSSDGMTLGRASTDILVYGTMKDSGGGTICTSDLNAKKSIENIDDRYDVLFDNLITRRFKYNDGTTGRYHTGFIAQEVEAAMGLANIESSEFASLCYDVVDGRPQNYGIRYSEIISLNTNQIQKLKLRVSALEDYIKKLEDRISQLENK